MPVWHTDLIMIDCLIKGNCVQAQEKKTQGEKKASLVSDAIKVWLLIVAQVCKMALVSIIYCSLVILSFLYNKAKQKAYFIRFPDCHFTSNRIN